MRKRHFNLTRILGIFSVLFLIILPLFTVLMNIYFYDHALKEGSKDLKRRYYAVEKERIRSDIDHILSVIKLERESYYDFAKKDLKNHSESAFQIGKKLFNKYKDTLPQEEIEQRIFETVISGYTHSPSESFFVLDTEGNLLNNSYSAYGEPLSKNIFSETEIKELGLEMVDFIEKYGEGFFYYDVTGSDLTKNKNKRIVYLRKFEPYNRIIGFAVYSDYLEQQIQKNTLSYLEEWEKQNAIFVFDFQGNLLTGKNKGKNILNLDEKSEKDLLWKPLRSEIARTGKVPNPVSGITAYYEKNIISYITLIEDWQWVLGMGRYTNELSNEIAFLQNELSRDSKENLFSLMAITIPLGLIFSFSSLFLMRKVTKDFNTFSSNFRDATTDGHSLNTDSLHFYEFYRLANTANQLIFEKEQVAKDRQRLRSLETVGFLAGGIAHEFNNILAGIFGNIDLANSKLPAETPGKEFLETALDSMDTARKLTDRLITFSDGGKPHIERIDCYLIEQEISLKLSQRGFTPQTEFEKELPKILADGKQLNIIWDSLISNIREAIPPEEGDPKKETVKVTAKRIALNDFSEFHLSGIFVEFSIIDKGPGIPAENLTKIFDPYFTTKLTGNGLGLSTIFTMIKHHNGHIDVQSQLDKGTSIIIRLPAFLQKK